MTELKKILTFMIVLFLTQYAVAEQPGNEVRGSIVDQKSGANLKGVNVFLELNGEVLLETITKEDGSFMFKLPLEQYKNQGIKVRMEKRGYKTEVLQTVPGKDIELNVQMKAKPRQVPIMVPRTSPTGQYIIV